MKLTKSEKEVLRVINSRFEKGRKEYKRGVHFEEAKPEAWLDEAIEEAADLLQYLVAARMRMKNGTKS